MNMKRYQPLWRIGLVWVLALLAVRFLAHPARAIAATSMLDGAKIDAFVRAQVERHGIPGLAMAVIQDDQVVSMQGYGKADQTGREVTPQTPFVLASVSKPITALAVMQLVEAGKVELDAPVQRYLPGFRVADALASQQITVRHLLQHTSGIPEQGCANRRFGAATLEQFVTRLQTIELDAAPGTRHFYCSGNYNILGRIVEVVSGQPYASYIEQQIFAPLEMRHSFTSEQEVMQHGLAQGYRWFFGLRVPFHEPFDPVQMPSGFLISSAEDMAHFVIAQLNGGRFGSTSILSPQGIAVMQAPGVPTGAGEATYGLGWKTGLLGRVPAVYHTGDHPEVHTIVLIEPGARRGAVLLMNANNLPALMTAFKDIQEGVARLLAGQQPASESWSLPRLYLIIDAVLGGVFGLALWPLLRIRQWEQRLRQQPVISCRRLLWIGLRLAWEFAVPIMLLFGVYLFLRATIGTLSWSEILLLIPDIGAWLWTVSLVMLLSGVTHLILLWRVLRRSQDAPRIAVPSEPAN
jgi:CubicO group peptidase (beta-lactamase class C family)